MFVEKETLLQDIENYRRPAIEASIKALAINSLEARNRALRVLALMCCYFEESFPILFESLRNAHNGQI
jgi:hypothetical protein